MPNQVVIVTSVIAKNSFFPSMLVNGEQSSLAIIFHLQSMIIPWYAFLNSYPVTKYSEQLEPSDGYARYSECEHLKLHRISHFLS